MSSLAPETFVLVVDDDAESRELTRRLIDRAGFGSLVQTCASGEEAQDFLAQRATIDVPALVLLDLNMPGMSGFDVLDWIRVRHFPTNLKVVMWSSSGDEMEQRRAAELGASAYLTKFASSAILGAVIHECLTTPERWCQPLSARNSDRPRQVADVRPAPRTKVNYQWTPAPMGQGTWPKPELADAASR
jgi:CheY-like chemotaxis protein